MSTGCRLAAGKTGDNKYESRSRHPVREGCRMLQERKLVMEGVRCPERGRHFASFCYIENFVPCATKNAANVAAAAGSAPTKHGLVRSEGTTRVRKMAGGRAALRRECAPKRTYFYVLGKNVFSMHMTFTFKMLLQTVDI